MVQCWQNVGNYNRDLLTTAALKLHVHDFEACERGVDTFEHLCDEMALASKRCAKWPTLNSFSTTVGSVVTTLKLGNGGGCLTFVDLAPEQHPAGMKYGQWAVRLSLIPTLVVCSLCDLFLLCRLTQYSSSLMILLNEYIFAGASLSPGAQPADVRG